MTVEPYATSDTGTETWSNRVASFQDAS